MKKIIITFAILLTFGCENENLHGTDLNVVAEVEKEFVGDKELLHKIELNNQNSKYEESILLFENQYLIDKTIPSKEEIKAYNFALLQFASENAAEFFQFRQAYILQQYEDEETIVKLKEIYSNDKRSLKEKIIKAIKTNDLIAIEKSLVSIEHYVQGETYLEEELKSIYYLGEYLVKYFEVTNNVNLYDESGYDSESEILKRAKKKLFSKIPPGYDGVLKDKIKEIDTEKSWIDIYNEENKSDYAIKKVEPYIGMTDQEALESTWGKPTKINKTINADSTREQWVYSGYKYLYFEEHYLVTIQK